MLGVVVSPVAVSHAPVDAIGSISDGENGRFVVEASHLKGEEPPDGVEQQSPHPEGVRAPPPLNHRRDLTCLVSLHEHAPKHRETAKLRVIRVA